MLIFSKAMRGALQSVIIHYKSQGHYAVKVPVCQEYQSISN